MIKYIAFDFDGTIADTFEVIKEEGNKILARYNISFDENLAKTIGLRKAILKSKFPIKDIPKCLLELKQNIQAKLISDVKTFPHIREVLLNLAKKYQLIILSSNEEKNIKGFLENNDLKQFFTIIYSDSSLFGKHRVLKRLCQKYQIHREELLYIGDEDRDIQASKKFGIKNIAVTWGYNTTERLINEKPDFLVKTADELIPTIERLSQYSFKSQ